MRTFVVDTHVLIWFLSQDPRLSAKSLTVLQDPEVRLIIPSIVLAEIKYLSHKGRFAQTLDEVLRVIDADVRCTVYPLDLAVILAAPPDLDIHDGLIVATALAQPLPIDGVLTRDEMIVASGLVPIVW